MWAATVAGEGVAAMFKGLSSPLATASMINAICFHTFAAATRALAADAQPDVAHASASEALALAASVAPALPLPTPRPSFSHIFLAGAAAGGATTLLVSPIDLLKVQLQARLA